MTGTATTGGDGSSMEQAIVITATSSIIGVPEEYNYIELTCGQRDVDYTIKGQTLYEQNDRQYDVISVKQKDGSKRDFWFDITSFYGEF